MSWKTCYNSDITKRVLSSRTPLYMENIESYRKIYIMSFINTFKSSRIKICLSFCRRTMMAAGSSFMLFREKNKQRSGG